MIACAFILGLLTGILLTEVSIILVLKLDENNEEPANKN